MVVQERMSSAMCVWDRCVVDGYVLSDAGCSQCAYYSVVELLCSGVHWAYCEKLGYLWGGDLAVRITMRWAIYVVVFSMCVLQ